MMIFINPYLEPIDKINLLERWIVVHSCIYYELNENVVTDHKYDENCKQLLELYKKYPKTRKKSRLNKVFKNYDGSTGFHLYKNLNDNDKTKVLTDAYFALNLNKRG